MVKIENLTLSYNGKEEILKNINIEIKKGESILFTGKSGSGKSSIINSINGLAERYDNAKITGNIIINGKNIKNFKIYEISMLISTVFQNPKTYFFNVNTTLELLFYLENIGLTKEEMDRRLDEMLKIFPISHLLNRDIFKLSGGEKQILCIAASYIAGTDIIVLDEPSSNLDQEKIEIINSMLKILKRKGITLIISEHRIYYLMDIIDRVFLIEKGKIKKEYSIEEFKKIPLEELNRMSLRDKKRTELKVESISEDGEFLIKELEYKFENTNEKLKLKNIHLKAGKIYGIVGSNGHGKSTLLRCLTGVEKKSKEEIYLKGKKIRKKERLKMTSLVMQDVNHQLFTDQVSDEIRLGIKDLDKEKAEDILRKLDLYELKDRHPMSLSGGQKQRLSIASVICKNSKIILFDEPTSGMDYENMIKTSKLIKSTKNKDNIIIIVSHDFELLNQVADNIIKM